MSNRFAIEKMLCEYNYPCSVDEETIEEEILEVIDECYFDTRCYLIVDNNNGEAYLYESLLIPLNNIDRYERMNKFIKDEQGKEEVNNSQNY